VACRPSANHACCNHRHSENVGQDNMISTSVMSVFMVAPHPGETFDNPSEEAENLGVIFAINRHTMGISPNIFESGRAHEN
jgi:hypothetical protein